MKINKNEIQTAIEKKFDQLAKAFEDVQTSWGTTLTVDPTVEVGATVTESLVSYDGDYTLANGDIIVVKDGKISAINKATDSTTTASTDTTTVDTTTASTADTATFSEQTQTDNSANSFVGITQEQVDQAISEQLNPIKAQLDELNKNIADVFSTAKQFKSAIEIIRSQPAGQGVERTSSIENQTSNDKVSTSRIGEMFEKK